MDHVGAAILLAQSVVERARIEEEKGALRICRLEQRIGRQIGDDNRDAAPGQRRDRGRGIVALLKSHLLKQEFLVQEFPGCIVVLDRQLRAREAVIGGRHVEQRDGGLAFGNAQIADLDLNRLGERDRRQGEQQRNRGPANQGLLRTGTPG